MVRISVLRSAGRMSSASESSPPRSRRRVSALAQREQVFLPIGASIASWSPPWSRRRRTFRFSVLSPSERRHCNLRDHTAHCRTASSEQCRRSLRAPAGHPISRSAARDGFSQCRLSLRERASPSVSPLAPPESAFPPMPEPAMINKRDQANNPVRRPQTLSAPLRIKYARRCLCSGVNIA